RDAQSASRHGDGFARCRRRSGIPGDADSRGLAQRADSGAWRRRLRQPDHVRRERAAGRDLHFGLSTDPVLQRESATLLAEAVRRWDETHKSQRLFAGFWYQAGTWTMPRWVVVKAEANAQGTNRRFVTTNRAGAPAYPEATYDEYAARGESENRNKEFKCGVAMDRLSDHRFLANYFRLYLHAAALNLVVRLRRLVAVPLAAQERAIDALTDLSDDEPLARVAPSPAPILRDNGLS